MSLIRAVRELLSDPDSGALSVSVALTVGAFLVSSVIVLDATFSRTMNEYLFIGYLAVWALHSHATRLISLAQDKAGNDA
jgi:hypothetical protein